jgi:hypothetical protein
LGDTEMAGALIGSLFLLSHLSLISCFMGQSSSFETWHACPFCTTWTWSDPITLQLFLLQRDDLELHQKKKENDNGHRARDLAQGWQSGTAGPGSFPTPFPTPAL